MTKKDYKRKKSRALTRQRKLMTDPEVQKMTDEINHQSGTLNSPKKKKST